MDLEGFKKRVIPMGDKLFRFALQYLRKREEAEDAVQEVLIKLWNRRDSLEEYRSLEAFAMTVTKNHCLDKLKAKKTYSLEDQSVYIAEKEEHTPFDELNVADTVKQVESIISELPEQQREIIHLRDVEGMEFSEISEITGLDLNLIRVNLSRARKKVREKYEKITQHEQANGYQYGQRKDKGAAGEIL